MTGLLDKLAQWRGRRRLRIHHLAYHLPITGPPDCYLHDDDCPSIPCRWCAIAKVYVLRQQMRELAARQTRETAAAKATQENQ